MIRKTIANATEALISHNWKESAPNAMMCSANPITGGIIDKTMLTGEWFAIFNNDDLGDVLEGFATREDAARAVLNRLAQVKHSS